MKKVIMLLALIAFVAVSVCIISPKEGFSATKYSVFCAKGKVEIDTRTLGEMKSARGSDTCMFRSFDYRMEADKFASAIGGVGSPCMCKS
jgi:hypothetical protein